MQEFNQGKTISFCLKRDPRMNICLKQELELDNEPDSSVTHIPEAVFNLKQLYLFKVIKSENMQWLNTSIPKARIPKPISPWHSRPGDISSKHSSMSQLLYNFSYVHHLFELFHGESKRDFDSPFSAFFFASLFGLLDLLAMTISIPRASNGINGCLDIDHQHTDVSHTWCLFENLKSTPIQTQQLVSEI